MNGIEIESITKLLYDNVKKLIKSGRLDDKEIVVFGANKPATIVVECLDLEGVTIKGIVDNNQQKREMIASGKMPLINGKYKLYAPEELLGTVKRETCILIASKCYHDMCSQLSDMGYDTRHQTVQLLEFDFEDNPESQVSHIDIEEMKRIQQQLLSHFHKVCDKQNLRHYLCGGTLLGARRHNGYIPWDDDIDVFMPVPDYLKFIEHFQETDEFALQNLDVSMAPFMFTRLVHKKTVLEEINYPYKIRMGVNIDIFPISGFPSDEAAISDFTKELLEGRNKWDEFWLDYGRHANEQEQYQKLRNTIKELMVRYDFDESETVGYIITGKLDRELMPRTCFDEEVHLTFEGEEYPVPIGYEIYLSNMYGDFMTLPPADQQVARHEFRAWYEK